MQRVLSVLLCVTTLSGCGALLPNDGPQAIDLKAENINSLTAPDYLAVTIDKRVTNIAGQYRPPLLSTYFKISSAKPSILINKGDQLLINVWEAGADGLFSSSTSKATQITTVVDQQGTIFVPYVGTVHAAGRSPEQLRATIESALKDRAIQPAVQVLVQKSLINSATVLGDVATPGNFPIPTTGIRVLDLLAAAGGSKYPTYDTQVTLKRGHTVASAMLENIFDQPRENVSIAPGDTLLVSNNPQSYTVFGAIHSVQQYPFQERHITLAEAIARAGGLDNMTADASGVFIFRFEYAAVAKQISPRADYVPPAALVPTIYRISLLQPDSFFLMRLFEIRNGDIIYVANHPLAEFGKFLQIIQPLLQNIYSSAVLVQRTTK